MRKGTGRFNNSNKERLQKAVSTQDGESCIDATSPALDRSAKMAGNRGSKPHGAPPLDRSHLRRKGSVNAAASRESKAPEATRKRRKRGDSPTAIEEGEEPAEEPEARPPKRRKENSRASSARSGARRSPGASTAAQGQGPAEADVLGPLEDWVCDDGEDNRPSDRGNATHMAPPGPTKNNEAARGADMLPRVDGRKRLYDESVKHNVPREPVAEYLERYKSSHEKEVHRILVQLIARHSGSRDWSFIRPIQDYIENDGLLGEEWPPGASDGERMTGDQYGNRLITYWRKNNMVQPCRDYISKALEDWRYETIRLARVRVCVQLLDQNDHSNEELWEWPPRLERYLCGRFDATSEKWPLDLKLLNTSWNEKRLALKVQRSSLDAMGIFEKHYRLAKKLYLVENAFLLPTDWPRGTSAGDYIVPRLRDSLRTDALGLLRPFWTELFERCDDPAKKLAYQRDWLKMRYGNNLLYGPFEAEWTDGWKNAENIVFAEAQSPALRTRFDDCKAMADESFEKYCEIVWPLKEGLDEVNKSMSAEEYVEKLSINIRQQVVENLHEAWKDAISDEDNPNAHEHGMQYVRIKSALREGKPVWHPGETPLEEEESDEETHPLHTTFDNDRSGIPGHWSYKDCLGNGGYGTAALWVQYDSRMNIVDRIVLKDVYLRARPDMSDEDAAWDKEKYWYGPISSRQPLEDVLPRKLNKLNDSDHMVKCHGSAVYDKHQMYRIYTEFCPHGDLMDLLRAHEEAMSSSYRAVDRDGNNIAAWIPTRALWAIFEMLASAVCLMQQCQLPGSGPPLEEHESIIHCDIKPANIFLSAPYKDNLWPGIVVPKLGDFGIARLSNETDPILFGFGGTRGWMAPEQCSSIRRNGRPYVVQKSDVWAIGRVMLSLVNLHHKPEEYTMNMPADDFPPPFRAEAETIYPQALLDLIEACLKRDAPERPTADRLWKAIHDEVGKMKGLKGLPMKMQPPPPDEVRLLYQEDIYRLFV